MKHAKSKSDSLSVQWPMLLGADCLGLDAVELDQLSKSLLTHAPRCLRLRPHSLPSQLPFATTAVPWHGQGFWLEDPTIRPGAFLQFAAGDYYIQDAASMLAITLCRVQPGQNLCDLCAAPGGKASGLLEKLNGRGFLLANEVIQSRLALLQTSLFRTRWSNHAVSNLDADRLAEFLPNQFHCVLVDAPCSGQSMVGRDKQSLAAFQVTQIDHSAARQQRIIEAAAKLVGPAGRLVYSTCTFAVAENEAIIENFLQRHPDWQLDPMPNLEAWSSPRLPGSYRLWPHRDKCDGGFAAALVRNNDCIEADNSPHISSKSNRARLHPWRGQLKDLEFFDVSPLADNHQSRWLINDTLHLFVNSPWPQLPMVSHSAIAIAEILANRTEPSYASSVVSLDGIQPRLKVELSTEQALQFVRGNSLSITQAPPSTGWCQVNWQGRPLSWGKYADGKLKNHFPKLLRSPSYCQS